jgi:hypothetical protein
VSERRARFMLVVASWLGPVGPPPAELSLLPDERFVPEQHDPASPIHRARIIHHTVRSCLNDAPVEPPRRIRVHLPDGNRYRNYACRSRKIEQCQGDGTRDRYYDERCETVEGRAIAAGPGAPRATLAPKR